MAVIVVTGATGTVGRQVVRQLLEDGRQVRAVTRDPRRAVFPTEVEVVAADVGIPDSLRGALAGAEALHLISFAGQGYAPLPNPEQIVKLAEEAGVRRLTVLSGYADGPVEEASRRSALEWTVLQPVEFMANLLDQAAGVREGLVRVPFAHCPSAMVDEADIAAVAVAALTTSGHAGQDYPITGPQAVTAVEAFGLIAAVVGRQIEIVELTEDDTRAELRAGGFAAEAIEALVALGTNPPPQAYTVSPTVETVTGRPPRTLRDWITDHASAFI